MYTNREIKFRAMRSPIDTQFIYGGYFSDSDEDGVKHFIFTLKDGAVEIDPKTVSQFVGIKDIHGNDVYEWDLVKRNEGGNYIGKYQVIYKETHFCLRTIQSHIFKRGAIVSGMHNIEIYTDISAQKEEWTEFDNQI